MNKKAIIISIAGKNLTKKETILIKLEKPWGIILFRRNIESFLQLKDLISLIKKITNNNNYPIILDEEGGSVSRLLNFLDNKNFSHKFFGDIFSIKKEISINLYKQYINANSKILKKLGVNINTVPVLDISSKNTSTVLKNRIYSSNKNTIKTLGSLCVKLYKKNKIFTVMKHIPGHGSTSSDSHKVLPVVNKSYKNLINNDFNCFQGIHPLFAMTAHILYKKIDPKNLGTHSKLIIGKIIRKKIGFKGILISDDISMKALKHDLVKNALKSIKAGCNLVLYCSGKYSESAKLLKHMPYIDDFTKKKTSEFYKFLS